MSSSHGIEKMIIAPGDYDSFSFENNGRNCVLLYLLLVRNLFLGLNSKTNSIKSDLRKSNQI